MGNDISTMYTKERNKKHGRRGYSMYKFEKETVISPKDYGIFRKAQKSKKQGMDKAMRFN